MCRYPLIENAQRTRRNIADDPLAVRQHRVARSIWLLHAGMLPMPDRRADLFRCLGQISPCLCRQMDEKPLLVTIDTLLAFYRLRILRPCERIVDRARADLLRRSLTRQIYA